MRKIQNIGKCSRRIRTVNAICTNQKDITVSDIQVPSVESGRPSAKESYDELLKPAEEVFDIKMNPYIRSREDVLVRVFVAYKMRERGYSYNEIGKVMNKNHSTIIHYIRTMEDFFAVPKAYRDILEKYKKYISLL